MATSAGSKTMERDIGVAGLVAFAAILASFLSVPTSPPEVDKPISDIVKYFADHHDALLGSGLVALLALPLFLWFATGLRALLARAEGEGGYVANLGLIAAVLLAALVAAQQVIATSLTFRIAAARDDEALIRSFYEVFTVFNGALAVATALFLAANGVLIVMTGMLPRWNGWLAMVGATLAVIGAAALLLDDTSGAAVAGFVGFLVFLLWLLVTAILLLLKSRTSASQSPAP